MSTLYEGEADDARISTVNTTNQSYPALVWRKFRRSVPGMIGLILVAELVMAGSAWVLKPAARSAMASATPAGVTNTEALGRILYTDYIYYFQIAGLVLLVAMIGAIVLTLRSRPGVRRQVISVQNARTAAMAVDMHDLKPGEGA